MLYEEAQWVGSTLLEHMYPQQTIINIGSSSLASRTIHQPHMNVFVFEPLKNKNISVIHTDIRNEEGVDLVGDLTDPDFISQLKKTKVDAFMCCNLLEHLIDRKPIIDALNEIVPVNGYLLITVPYHYPYHLDPIDTMYRPGIKSLSANFPSFKIIKGQILSARRVVSPNDKPVFEKNYFQQLSKNTGLFFRLLVRCAIPFYKPLLWWITMRDLFFMFRRFKVTCLLLKRTS